MSFAILAPIPLEHLESGLLVLQSRSYVSYGSQKYELFRRIKKEYGDAEAPVLIYPSFEDSEVKLTYQVSWLARYVGSVEETSEKYHDQKEGHRPVTTEKYPADNANGWAVFWRVRDLQQLPPDKHVPIRELFSQRTGQGRRNAPPRGPEIIERPAWA